MIKTAPALSLICLLASSALAQEAPAPRQMPRIPVSRQMLTGQRDQMPVSRQVQGSAIIIDSERLRIGETDLRLFGIVPPQLAATFGPQARAALDSMAGGQSLSCQIRDRDRDGRLLATCRNGNDSDLALEMLKRGLAVTARGSIAGTELASSYINAEQAAQGQKVGLWSVSVAASAAAAAPPRQESVALPSEPEPRKEEKLTPRTDKNAKLEAEAQAKIAADVLTQQAQSGQSRMEDMVWQSGENAGFIERYQTLASSLLALAAALAVVGARWREKRRERCDEMKAVAAALRGELMAARSICFARIKSITNEAEDRAATWPRIRITLYQAYVGRLGLLGAELARLVSSIYGHASDYASLYNSATAVGNAPKRHALELLIKHIDAVAPRLAEIERTGSAGFTYVYRPMEAQQPPAPPPSGVEAEGDGVAGAAEEAPVAAPQVYPARINPASLWEAVRHFIQNRGATTRQRTVATEAHVAEYAAMIEADMARYQYGDDSAEARRKKG